MATVVLADMEVVVIEVVVMEVVAEEVVNEEGKEVVTDLVSKLVAEVVRTLAVDRVVGFLFGVR